MISFCVRVETIVFEARTMFFFFLFGRACYVRTFCVGFVFPVVYKCFFCAYSGRSRLKRELLLYLSRSLASPFETEIGAMHMAAFAYSTTVPCLFTYVEPILLLTVLGLSGLQSRFGGKTTYNLSGLAPKRDCSSAIGLKPRPTLCRQARAAPFVLPYRNEKAGVAVRGCSQVLQLGVTGRSCDQVLNLGGVAIMGCDYGLELSAQLVLRVGDSQTHSDEGTGTQHRLL